MELKRKYAFISYSHKDEKIAKWLQRKLEQYRLPSEIVNDCENTRYLRPIFRDRTDLNVGVLHEEIRRNLEASKYLIVLCSPESAASPWVNEEIRSFIALGRLEFIIPVIVGEYDSSCVPTALLDYYKEYPDRELLTVSFGAEDRESVLIRVVSRMLGLEYDVLWGRHKRMLRKRAWAIASLSLVGLFLIYWLALPISLSVALIDAQHNLPVPDSGIVVIGDSQYPVESLDTVIHVSGIPGYKRCTSVSVRFDATYYEESYATAHLGAGMVNGVELNLCRDASFGEFSGHVYGQDGKAIEGAKVQVGSEISYTDDEGRFCVVFPPHLQTETKELSITKDGYQDLHREDECPSCYLGYVLRSVL